ncbi:hypothetical protein [Nocardia sp. CNY236]|uniref:hypothetical protein n=1 Tax=Nocardia sp. CNY236 TaxID=1169152 RepID=UPI0004225AE0|nr:hypothetical protein [Nocardia sp. CNY236]
MGATARLTVTLVVSGALVGTTALAHAAPDSGSAGGPVNAVAPPQQPTSGPGGSDYAYTDMRVSSGGEGDNAWFAFEPVGGPPLASAPLAVITHGFGEYSGYEKLHGLIRHTVRKGSVVIYPRWQASPRTPCPKGPGDIEPCVQSAVEGIRGGLSFLQSDSARVQPQLDRTSYFGLSFGGILTSNFLNRHEALELPRPRAVFLDDPHDGGFAGKGEPALDDTLAGIPADTLFQCHIGDEGIVALEGNQDSSCNALFPKLGHIPPANKNIVLTYTDKHGTPPLLSAHGVSNGSPNPDTRGSIDAYDYFFIWKVWDALRSAADSGADREYALGDTPEHRYMGTWSDGTPVTPLKIQDHAPIRP